MKRASGAVKRRVILVVEDEQLVLQVTEMILVDLGHEVHVATSGAQALEQIEAQQGQFDLVIIDQGLPDLDGISVAKQAITRFPELRFILATGYASDDVVEGAREAGIAHVLDKPYDVEQLAEAVGGVLGDTALRTTLG